MTAERKIKSFPTGWPSDKRSRILERDDVAIITHPDRKPQQYDYASDKWSPLGVA